VNGTQIEIANQQDELTFAPAAVRELLRLALEEQKMEAELSVAVVGDEQMRELNAKFLGRNGPTDVLAFPYEKGPDRICGEIVVNASEAVRQAQHRPHSAEDELLLYVVHGLLHLIGYEDNDPRKRQTMRQRERLILRRCGRHVES